MLKLFTPHKPANLIGAAAAAAGWSRRLWNNFKWEDAVVFLSGKFGAGQVEFAEFWQVEVALASLWLSGGEICALCVCVCVFVIGGYM